MAQNSMIERVRHMNRYDLTMLLYGVGTAVPAIKGAIDGINNVYDPVVADLTGIVTISLANEVSSNTQGMIARGTENFLAGFAGLGLGRIGYEIGNIAGRSIHYFADR